MLKLIIVDDELWIREGLKQTIDWSTHGITLVGEAENGQQALALLESEVPDIVISDIRMPAMDGMELMEEAKRRGIEVRIILISGFSDFCYAQKAVKLGAFDYILKPIEEQVLLSIIDRCADDIMQRRKLSSRLAELSDLKRESVPLARQKHLELCLSRPMSDHELEPIWKALDIDLDPARIVVLSAVVHDWGERGLNENGCSLMRYALGKLMEEILAEEDVRALACPLHGHEFADSAILASFGSGTEQASPNADAGAIIRGAERAVRRTRQLLGIRISVGVSWPVERENLFFAFKEALTYNLDYFVYGGGRVYRASEATRQLANINIAAAGTRCQDWLATDTGNEKRSSTDETANSANKTELLDTSLTNRMVHAMLLSDESRLSALLDDQLALLLEWIKHRPAMSIRSEFNLFIDLFLSKWQEHFNSAAPVNHIKSRLYRCPLTDWKQTVMAIFLTKHSAAAGSGQSQKRIINKALRFIHDNFHLGISLGDVAESIYLNPSYFSRIFHAEVGEPLSKYLIRMRMSKAKELLEGTPLKIYEIADLVGYKDFRHFVKTFKEWEGMTPAQFRNYGA